MDRLKALSARRKKLEETGKSAREFLGKILDPKSFVEMDTFTFSKLGDDEAEGEGVISGFGTVNGNQVSIYSQNIEVLKGGVGKIHADKIIKCMLKASNAGVPLISVIDTYGARLEEGIEVLEGYAEILGAAARLDVPHIAIVKSASYGMMSAVSQLADFCLMVDKSVMASSSPLIIAQSSGKDLKPEDVGGTSVHSKVSGLADYVGSEDEVAAFAKTLINYLSTDSDSSDDPNRTSAVLNNTNNAMTILTEVLDKKSFLELGAQYEKSVICGLGLLDGVSVGVIAHNPEEGEYLSNKALRKISKWVNVFNALHLPLINFVNTKGVVADLSQEQDGLVENMARVVSAYANYEGNLLSVITGDAVGFGYSAFASNGIGYDYTLAWANSQVTALPAESMAMLAYKDVLAQKGNTEKARTEIAEQYKDEVADSYFAARKGYIDNVIEPALTRQYLIAALGMLI